MKKISFIGDIMCEPLLLKASKTQKGYDFNGLYSEIKSLFDKSDFIIGNLETPIAGEDLKYVDRLLSFNAPEGFVDAIINAGVDLISIANNHVFDRGKEGLEKTIKLLDTKDIMYTGAYSSKESRKEAIYFTLGDTKFALIAYTYGTNYWANKVVLDDDELYKVNLLRPQKELYFIPKRMKMNFFERVIRKLLSYIEEEKRFDILNFLRLKPNFAREDDSLNLETIKPYIEKMQNDIKKAKENSDFVIFYPHIGGQFNKNPGIFSKHIFEKAKEAGADAIVACHAHVVQKYENTGIPAFYSIGNFSMSPNSSYLLFENLPQYGIIPHFYMVKNKIKKISFSIIKIIEEKNQQMRVFDTYPLFANMHKKEDKEKLESDIKQIFNTVFDSKIKFTNVQSEYIIFEDKREYND